MQTQKTSPKELKKIAKEAEKNGFLDINILDAVLENDDTFKKNVKSLIRSLGKVPVKSADVPESELDELVAADKEPARRAKGLKSDYIGDINQFPKMDKEDEIRYAKRLEFFKERMIHSVENSKLPKATKELFLQFKDCRSGDVGRDLAPLCSKTNICPKGKEAFLRECCAAYTSVRGKFVERNLHLVVSRTSKYKTYGIPWMDLIQEGNAALIRAVEKFDWRKGLRFYVYAGFWIKQAVERYITANKLIVRVPNYLQQKMRRYKRDGVISTDDAGVSVGEVSDTFELSREVAGHLLETGRGHISLDAPSSNDDDYSLSGVLSVEDEEVMPEDEHESLKDRLRDAIAELNDQEQFIIHHRFGLEGKETKTLEEIGKLLKVSRERIRQLQIRALKKLNRSSLQERLVPFLA